eukprot:234192-Prymnesium_polylepis.2
MRHAAIARGSTAARQRHPCVRPTRVAASQVSHHCSSRSRTRRSWHMSTRTARASSRSITCPSCRPSSSTARAASAPAGARRSHATVRRSQATPAAPS